MPVCHSWLGRVCLTIYHIFANLTQQHRAKLGLIALCCVAALLGGGTAVFAQTAADDEPYPITVLDEYEYAVQAGDTWNIVATQTGLTISELKRATSDEWFVSPRWRLLLRGVRALPLVGERLATEAVLGFLHPYDGLMIFGRK